MSVKVAWLLLISFLFTACSGAGALARKAREGRSVRAGACTRYAARSGTDSASRLRRLRRHHHGRPGSKGNPFASTQRLVRSLGPGQTGCLRTGAYDLGGELTFGRSGQAGAPITLRSYPGERATLWGGTIYLPARSSHIRLQQLNIDTAGTSQAGLQIMSARDALIGDRITNHADHASCIILGSNIGWGEAVGTVISHDVIHECGSPADGNQDHAIYFDNSVGAQITNNVIWGTSGFAIHLYENARDNVIRHNVMDDNRYGVVFGDNSGFRSSGNIVANNVISDTTDSYGAQSYWNGAAGRGNILARNCIYNAVKGAIGRPTIGFQAIGNVVARPRFVDAARHRYRLRAGSRCLRVVGFDAASPSVAHAIRHHGRKVRGRGPQRRHR
jgi:parallel beta-helix repeat protein